MTTIERLKLADKENRHEDVIQILGELLEESFDRSVKLVVDGAKKFLKGGVLNGNQSKYFWESDLPIRFGEQFAGSSLYHKDFWRGFYRMDSLRVNVVEQLVKNFSQSVESGIRQNQVFRNSEKWQALKPLLEPSFIRQCDLMEDRIEVAEQGLMVHQELLQKVSRETLVVHFAVWLETQYLRSDNDVGFERELEQYFEVLEKVLNLSHEYSGEQQPKESGEIHREIEKLFKKAIRNQSIELDTFQLFSAVDEFLWAKYDLDLFSRQGWLIEDVSPFRMVPPNEQFGHAWAVAAQKFHVADCFELLPWSDSDHEYFDKCRQATNDPRIFQSDTEFYCAVRFLYTYLGDSVVEKASSKLGFGLIEALQLLRSNKDCYKQQYVTPRAQVKGAGGSLNQLLAANLRFCVESRLLSSFVNIAGDYKGTCSIPAKETQSIYSYFSKDIHNKDLNLDGALLLGNASCQMLLTRYFSGDLKTYLFNILFKDFHQTFSTRFEDQVGHNFEVAGFKTIVRRKIPYGEVDVFAYKEGTLFLIEAKVTYGRSRAGQVADVYDRLSSGSGQLHRAMGNFAEIWDDIRGDLNAQEDLKDLCVIPLLVHNSFEYDHCYFDDILKVTEFELRMLFADDPDMNFRLSLQHREQFAGEEFSEAIVKEELQALEKDDFESMRLLKVEHPEVEDWISAIEDSRFWCKIFGRELPLTKLTRKRIV